MEEQTQHPKPNSRRTTILAASLSFILLSTIVIYFFSWMASELIDVVAEEARSTQRINSTWQQTFELDQSINSAIEKHDWDEAKGYALEGLSSHNQRIHNGFTMHSGVYFLVQLIGRECAMKDLLDELAKKKIEMPCYLFTGNFSKALELVLEQEEPKSLQNLYNAGVTQEKDTILLILGEPSQAEAAARNNLNALSAGSTQFRSRIMTQLWLAEYCRVQGKFEEASIFLNEVVDEFSNSPLTNQQISKGDFEYIDPHWLSRFRFRLEVQKALLKIEDGADIYMYDLELGITGLNNTVRFMIGHARGLDLAIKCAELAAFQDEANYFMITLIRATQNKPQYAEAHNFAKISLKEFNNRIEKEYNIKRPVWLDGIPLWEER